jgi:hypothetical protein
MTAPFTSTDNGSTMFAADKAEIRRSANIRVNLRLVFLLVLSSTLRIRMAAQRVAILMRKVELYR